MENTKNGKYAFEIYNDMTIIEKNLPKEVIEDLIADQYIVLDVDAYYILVKKNTPNIDIIKNKYENYIKVKQAYSNALRDVLFFATSNGGHAVIKETEEMR